MWRSWNINGTITSTGDSLIEPGSAAIPGIMLQSGSNSNTPVDVVSGTLTKSGVGNLVLTGSNSYTGGTSVSAGRLSINGVLGDSPVAVLADAELGGSGSIAGPVSIASGGRLAPGNSIESLATGTATFVGGAIFAYEVDSSDLGALGTAADLLVVTGDLNLSTDINNRTLLSFTDIAGTAQPFIEDTTIFTLVNYTGAWNGGLFSYNGVDLANGSRFMAGSQQWEITYDSLAGLACGGFSIWRRRKRA